MILIFETGNTTINVVVYDSDTIRHKWVIIDERVNDIKDFEDIVNSLLEIEDISLKDFEIVLISSVVKRLGAIEEEYCKKNNLKFLNIKDKSVVLNFEARDTLGADLVANIFAGIRYYKENFIIVDMGTATTFSAVGKDGKFLGVSFISGILTTLKALGKSCDLLPEIGIVEPKSVIGKTTVEAMQSGIYYGYIGIIKEIVKNMIEEVGTDLKVILTGGYSSLLIDKLNFVLKVEKDLTFEGIKMIYEYNRKNNVFKNI
jgi:type III pantothenate kinase